MMSSADRPGNRMEPTTTSPSGWLDLLAAPLAQREGMEFWLPWLLLLLATAACFWGAFRFLHRKRIIEDTPTSRIRSAAQGYVELQGRGELLEGAPIVSPLSDTRCLWYRYTVEERVRSGRHRGWRVVDQGRSDELFRLIDETGECVIDPDGAEVHTRHRRTWYRGQRRYREWLLLPGEPLYALGLFQTIGGDSVELDPAGELRELLRRWKQDSQRLLERFDRNRDGRIDMEEWAQVRREAAAQIAREQAEIRRRPPVNLLGDTRDGRRPFLLSTRDERDLVHRYTALAAACLAGFFLLGLVLVRAWWLHSG
ncbi:MAG: hypothetical protein D6786_02810 [Gammaproteobacteria bacterium]|nr:MAG: hypothetical protein D6786_02810 [Gammaproteobacteria bacterium]